MRRFGKNVQRIMLDAYARGAHLSLMYKLTRRLVHP